MIKSRDAAYSWSCHAAVPSAIRATANFCFKNASNASIKSAPIAHSGRNIKIAHALHKPGLGK